MEIHTRIIFCPTTPSPGDTHKGHLDTHKGHLLPFNPWAVTYTQGSPFTLQPLVLEIQGSFSTLQPLVLEIQGSSFTLQPLVPEIHTRVTFYPTTPSPGDTRVIFYPTTPSPGDTRVIIYPTTPSLCLCLQYCLAATLQICPWHTHKGHLLPYNP